MYGPSTIMISLEQEFEYKLQVNDSNGDNITVTTNINSTVVMNGSDVCIYGYVANATGIEFSITAKVSLV